MALDRHSLSSGDQLLRAAKHAYVRGNLRPLTSVVAGLFAFIAVIKFWLARESEGTSLIVMVAGCATAMLAIRVLVGLWEVPDRLVYPLLILVQLIALVTAVGQLYVLGRPHDSTNFALVLVGTGLVSLSPGWTFLCFALIWGSWFYIATFVHSSNLWMHYGFFLLWMTALAAVLQAARSALLRRLIQTEAQIRERLEELVAQRTRQLEESLEQLRHSERLASVGTLAAGIAHEINNPVGMMLLAAEEQLATATSQKDDTTVRLSLEIIANTKRCAQIVKSVLQFARHEPAQRKPDDVNEVVRSAVSLMRHVAAQRGGEIHITLTDDLPAVMLNRVELEQVFLNLIRNGIDATEEEPHIAITTEKQGNEVRVTVVDNGRGIPTEDRRHIFDPFFTTRQNAGGTGLGLSLTYGIITDHGGTIRVDDVDGKGTAMIVSLPVVADTP